MTARLYLSEYGKAKVPMEAGSPPNNKAATRAAYSCNRSA